MNFSDFIQEFAPPEGATYKNIYKNSRGMLSFEGDFPISDTYGSITFRVTIKKDMSYKIQYINASDSMYYQANKIHARQRLINLFNWWINKYRRELRLFF